MVRLGVDAKHVILGAHVQTGLSEEQLWEMLEEEKEIIVSFLDDE